MATAIKPKLWMRVLFWVAKRMGAQMTISLDQPDYHYAINIIKVRLEV